jgi:multidrug efflux pump subunit AcrA (membrane-fusion protein)
VHISAYDALHPTRAGQSLVAGMFCKVIIPGKIAKNVVEIPMESVSFSKDDAGFRTVYLAKESPDDGRLRLTTAKVRESHIAGESIFLKDGLDTGDQIVTTRLINPLANSLLNTNSFDGTETD